MATAKETIDDLLSSLKDRFTNPVAFSFLCSWVVINWRVILALLWTDDLKADIHAAGGLVEYVSSQFTWWRSFCLPLLLGTCLVLLLPIVKALLQMFYAYVNREGMNRVLAIKQDGNISVRSYLRLRKDFSDRTSELMRIVKEDTEASGDRNRLQTSIIELQRHSQSLTNEVQALQELLNRSIDVGRLNGTWRLEFMDNANRTGSELVTISDGTYVVHMSRLGTVNRKHAFNLVGYKHDPNTRHVTFVKEVVEEEKPNRPPLEHFLFNDLNFDMDGNTMHGTENRLTKVKYTRIKDV